MPTLEEKFKSIDEFDKLSSIEKEAVKSQSVCDSDSVSSSILSTVKELLFRDKVVF